MNIHRQENCRVCGGTLEKVLDLGEIFVSSFVEKYTDDVSDRRAPVVLSKCLSCGLVQLMDTVEIDEMYKTQYWYSSALNKSMVSSLQNVVVDVESKVSVDDYDTVLDIGCNDGTLLRLYQCKNLYKVGFDPAPNLSPSEDVLFINDYFTKEKYFEVYGNEKAKVITAIAMFYDLPDPNKFLEDVKAVLRKDGIFVIQFTDLLSMFKVCAFDNICHEHLEYYRLLDVVLLLRRNGFDVVDVLYNDVNGGSIRVTACLAGSYLPKKAVVTAISEERVFFETNTFDMFEDRINSVVTSVKNFLLDCEKEGKTVYLLGASTKGNTLLQVCGINDKHIPIAGEVNPDKFGLVTLGSNIKIVSEDEALSLKPDYFFVPVWHFKRSLLTKKKIVDYINSGGKLVFPLPEFHIIGKEELEDDKWKTEDRRRTYRLSNNH